MGQPAVSQQLRVLRHLGLVVGDATGARSFTRCTTITSMRSWPSARTPTICDSDSRQRPQQAVAGMSVASPALLAAAAGVGFGHAILPDHWVPFAVLGRTRRYPLSRSLGSRDSRVSPTSCLARAGCGHHRDRTPVPLNHRDAQDTIIGCLLIATGIGFTLLELTGHGPRPRPPPQPPRTTTTTTTMPTTTATTMPTTASLCAFFSLSK